MTAGPGCGELQPMGCHCFLSNRYLLRSRGQLFCIHGFNHTAKAMGL